MSSKHVVLVPFPAQGHILPIFYLAKRLADHGFAVTIINIDSIHETVKRSWKHDNIRLESVSMELKVPKGFGAESLNEVNTFVQAICDLEEDLADLLAKLNAAHAVSCVISDFYHFSAPDATAKAGIRSVCYWPGMAAWASIQYGYDLLLGAGLVPVEDSDVEKLVSFLPGLKPFKAKFLPLYLHGQTYFARGCPRYLSLAMRRIKMDNWILVNSFYELEPDVLDAMQDVVPGRLVPVGPLFPLKGTHPTELEVSLRPESRESLDWLDRQSPKSVFYISFGSTTSFSSEELKELTQGVEASKQPFLMVASRELVPDLELNHFFDVFVKRAAQSGSGLVVSWAPQLAVLQHQGVGGFLTHCGWNSTLESLTNGVPMLGWPRDSDQNTNCKFMIEEQGIGMELCDKSSSGICRAIVELMTNRDIRQRALQIERDARAAASKDGSSYKNLEAFFDSL